MVSAAFLTSTLAHSVILHAWPFTKVASAVTASYLVTVFTERDPSLVVILFTSQWNVARPTLEATVVVRPV